MAHFYIIGAGPGDKDLLTLRAAKLIAQADIILHDRLIAKEVLELAREDAELIYVGKRQGQQEVAQQKIFQQFVQVSKTNKKVVRLKGGDPFVFGRGIEEYLFIRELDCQVEIVPGVSSSIGLSALAGIPLTARGSSQAFAVITGQGLDGSEVNWSNYCSVDTLVILMGVRRRVEIAETLISLGRNPKERTCFIQDGSTKNQKIFTGSLEEVASKRLQVKSPAVWIIGNVVSFYEQADTGVSSEIALDLNISIGSEFKQID